MIKPDLLAKDVYDQGVQSLYRGVAKELLPEVKEFTGGYWAMVDFLINRGAMLVGDMADPFKVVGHLGKEKKEAEAEIGRDYLALKSELGDVVFIGLAIGGLLWNLIGESEKMHTKEVIVWSHETALDEQVDLNNAVVSVARGKNVENYPEKDLQLVGGETVGQVVARLPSIYAMLRARRGVVSEQSRVSVAGYRHNKASMTDQASAGLPYDA